MAGFDVQAAVRPLLTVDRHASFAPESLGEEAEIVRSVSFPRMLFPAEFTAPSVGYRLGDAIIPTRFVRETALSDRLVPLPVAAEAEVTDESTELPVKKLFDVPGMARAVASGTLEERDGTSKEFVAVSRTDSAEFWISIQGSLTGADGETYACVFEADGAAPKGSHDEDAFDGVADGSLFRVHAPGDRRPNIEEASFASLNRISAAANPEALTITLSGEALVDGAAADVRAVYRIGRNTVTLEIITGEGESLIFAAAAPRDRVRIQVAGGFVPDDEGFVAVFDRATGEEIRRVPVKGRLVGSAWDGDSLWQVTWPEGQALKIDLREGGGVTGEATEAQVRRANGVAFDDDLVVFGVCSANIAEGSGDSVMRQVARDTGELVNQLPRPHAASCGFTTGPAGILAAVGGWDQTPSSPDSAILILNRDTGATERTVIFPRNFYIQDIDQESDNSVLLIVTPGLGGLTDPGALYQLGI
jgi:hypothetical protein